MECFSFLQDRGIHIGVFSDYPVVEKVARLGLSHWISVALCATDAEIGAFKPHPAGFFRACAVWGLAPEEVLYVGDRPEVDAVGASRAGMPCAILRSRRAAASSQPPANNSFHCTTSAELRHLLALIV
jgi:FMN phosphatase YigB (HAD superfamily)